MEGNITEPLLNLVDDERSISWPWMAFVNLIGNMWTSFRTLIMWLWTTLRTLGGQIWAVFMGLVHRIQMWIGYISAFSWTLIIWLWTTLRTLGGQIWAVLMGLVHWMLTWMGYISTFFWAIIAWLTNWIGRIWRESKQIWIVAGPTIVTQLSLLMINLMNQNSANSIGSKEATAYYLVSTIITNFSNRLMFGLISGLETLCGQAYGANQHHMLGVYLQRAWIIVIGTSMLLLPLYIFASPLLELLGWDKDDTEMANTFAYWSIPLLISTGFSNSFLMFLEAQSKNMIMILLAVLSFLIHYILSKVPNVWRGVSGISRMMSYTILAYLITNVGQVLYLWLGRCPDTWTGFTRLAFHDLGSVVLLSIESATMLCLEEWYNAVPMLLTSFLDVSKVKNDALSICLTITSWGMVISLGFLSAASARVSNELGRGDSNAAKFAMLIALITSLIIGILEVVVLIFFRGHVLHISGADDDVIKEFAELWILVVIALILNSVQPVLSGIAVGAGWQNFTACVNIVCNYIIGISLAVYLSNVIESKIKGVCIGMLTGTFIQIVILCISFFFTDWDNEVVVTQERINRWTLAAEPGYGVEVFVTYIRDTLFTLFSHLTEGELLSDLTEDDLGIA